MARVRRPHSRRPPWRDAQTEEPMITASQYGTRETIRRFILSSIAIADLDDDADLFESGIVNSLFAVQLMTFIEKTFALEVAEEDLEIDNFRSLNATAGFVLRKNGVHAAAAD